MIHQDKTIVPEFDEVAFLETSAEGMDIENPGLMADSAIPADTVNQSTLEVNLHNGHTDIDDSMAVDVSEEEEEGT